MIMIMITRVEPTCWDSSPSTNICVANPIVIRTRLEIANKSRRENVWWRKIMAIALWVPSLLFFRTHSVEIRDICLPPWAPTSSSSSPSSDISILDWNGPKAQSPFSFYFSSYVIAIHSLTY
jgi:hypothetical protein